MTTWVLLAGQLRCGESYPRCFLKEFKTQIPGLNMRKELGFNHLCTPVLHLSSLRRTRRNKLSDSRLVSCFRHEEGGVASDSSSGDPLSIYLYIPNIVGYMRILMNCVAFAFCLTNKKLFSALYFISFVFDGVDGWFARKLNQVSTLGAALDMVTDRVSTVCLLVILSQIYRPGLIFLGLLTLDIASHWLQMYSSLLLGKNSHKEIDDISPWLLRTYYRHRLFMGGLLLHRIRDNLSIPFHPCWKAAGKYVQNYR